MIILDLEKKLIRELIKENKETIKCNSKRQAVSTILSENRRSNVSVERVRSLNIEIKPFNWDPTISKLLINTFGATADKNKDVSDTEKF